MPETRAKYDEEFKKNVVSLSYASPRSVKQLPEDLEISIDFVAIQQFKYSCAAELLVRWSESYPSGQIEPLFIAHRESRIVRGRVEICVSRSKYYSTLTTC